MVMQWWDIKLNSKKMAHIWAENMEEVKRKIAAYPWGNEKGIVIESFNHKKIENDNF